MEKDDWNKLVIENGSEFLQSWQWGNFQEALGRRVERVWADDFLAQIIFISLPLKLDYGYLPRGPILIKENYNEAKVLEILNDHKDKGTIFYEIEQDLQIRQGVINKDPRQLKETLFVDLSKDIKNIYKDFHRKHRYSIRKAKEKGVVVGQEKGWQEFFYILKQTTKRQDFRIWPADYYKKMWDVLGKEGMVEIWSAFTPKKERAASHLYILFGDCVTHLFGGMDYELRDYFAPYAIHWQAMKSFKERGFKKYDLWGIDKERWPELTRFKERFGGYKYVYPKATQIILRPNWFKLYRVIQKWRKV